MAERDWKQVYARLKGDPDFQAAVEINLAYETTTSLSPADEAIQAVRERGVQEAASEIASALADGFRIVDHLRALREKYGLTIQELNPVVQAETDLVDLQSRGLFL